MGAGASSKKRRNWSREFHLTANVESPDGEGYQQIFPIWTIAITSNQRQLASATGDNRILLWCLVTHQMLIPLTGHADTIWRLAYSPDDALLASTSADETVRLWEVMTGLPVMVLPRCHSHWVWSLAWSPDGTRLVTGGSDARLLVWDAKEAWQAAQAVAEISAMADRDPAWAEKANREAETAARTKRPILAWQAHEKSINEVTFCPTEAQMLVSVGAEGSLAIWDVDTGALDCRVMGHIGAITCVSVSPSNGELIATGGEDATVRMWDLSDVDPGSHAAKSSREKTLGLNLAHFTLKGHQAGITAVRFCGDGRLLASVSKDCDVRVWFPSLQNPTLCAKFPAHEAWIRDLAWNPDQRFLYTAAGDGLVQAWVVPKKYHHPFYAEDKHSKKKGSAKYGA
jgi:WD40 repeat protein